MKETWIHSAEQKLNARGVLRQHSSLGALDRRLFLVICFLTEMLRGERDHDTRILEASMEHSCSAVQQLLPQTYPTSISTGFLRHRPLSARGSCSWSHSTWRVFTQHYSTARIFFLPASLPQSNSSWHLAQARCVKKTFMFSDILGKIQPSSKVIWERDLPFPLGA